MHPQLIDLFGYTLHAYSASLVIAFMGCSLLCLRDAQVHRSISLPPHFCLLIFICGFIGARAFAILETGNWTQLWRALLIWESGLTFYGALISAFLGGFIFLKLKRLPFLKVTDVAVVYIALGIGIGRMGCFLNGCCWGSLCTLPWAVQFPKYSWVYRHHLNNGLIDHTAQASLPVHPTQLYLVLGIFAVFIILRMVLKRTSRDGLVLSLFCLMYGSLCFIVEMFRGDTSHSFLFMTTSQVISLVLILSSALIFLIMRFYSKSF